MFNLPLVFVEKRKQWDFGKETQKKNMEYTFKMK
jgi:hypothetical protein